MIQEVDECLRQLLLTDLAKMPGNLIKDPEQIAFGLVGGVQSTKDKPRINLYLHDIRENTSLRDTNFHHEGKEGSSEKVRRRAAVRLDLTYLVTAHAGDDPSLEHRLLSDVLGVFLRNSTVPERFLGDSLKPEGPLAVLLSAAQSDHPALADPRALWQAIGGNLRPTIGLVATAAFNPFETHLVKVVREALVGIGQGIDGDEAQRPLDVRSIRVSAAGLVTDSVSQQPLPGVHVAVSGRDETTTTDSRGFFYFRNLPPNRYRLTFSRKGYASQEAETVAPPPGRSDALEPIGVALEGLGDAERKGELQSALSSGSGWLEVEKKVTVTLVGRLKYPDGRPASYIPVRAGNQLSMTDGEGMYHFEGLPPGEHEVTAEVAGHGAASVDQDKGMIRVSDEPVKPKTRK